MATLTFDDANAGTAEDARLAAANYVASDQFFRLVAHRTEGGGR